MSGILISEIDKSEITGEHGLVLLKKHPSLYLNFFILDKLLTGDMQRWKEKVLRGS